MVGCGEVGLRLWRGVGVGVDCRDTDMRDL